MLKLLLFFYSTLSLTSQIAIVDPLEEIGKEELSQETSLNDEEDFLALPKKGNRPQVVEIPLKNSL